MKFFLSLTASLIIHLIILNPILESYLLNKTFINKKSPVKKSILLVNSEYIQKKEKPAPAVKKIEKPKPIKKLPVKKKIEQKKSDNTLNYIKPAETEKFYSEHSEQTTKTNIPNNSSNNKPSYIEENKKEELNTIPPVYKKNPPPVYPKLAKKRGQQGTTIIDALVGADGKIKKVTISNSSGYQILDNAAVKAVKEWLFIPASIGNKKIEMQVAIPVRFEITD